MLAHFTFDELGNARTAELAERMAAADPRIRVLRQGRLPFGEVWLRAEDAADPCAHVTTTWTAVAPARR